MISNIKKSVLLAIVVLGFSFLHEYYVSVFQLEVNKNAKTIECSIKAFSNDLELMLKTNSGKALQLNNAQHQEAINVELKKYLSKNVAFSQAEKKLKLHYIGFEYEQDATYVFFEVSLLDPDLPFSFQNTWFMDVFKGQINIAHLKMENYRQSEYFKSNTKFHTFLVHE